MSSENEGGQPPAGEPGAEPTTQFDAFRARRADEREQQETQTSYTFPPEYAADPGTVFPQADPGAPAYGDPEYGGPGYVAQCGGPEYGPPPGADPGRGMSGARRWRSVAVFGGAVLVAAVLGLGAWAAFGSSGASPSDTAAGSGASAAAAGAGTGTGATRHTKALTFRVTIQSVGADSFTGTVLANGANVTIALTDATRFGTKAHPFSRSDLTAGETVIVRGRRTGTDTVTATAVAANTEASSGATGDDAGSGDAA